MRNIYMIGDSTMQYNDIFTYPQTGWGQVLHLFAKKDVKIYDHAKNGRSSKSFIEEGLFDIVLNNLQKGDYVICQFGHNDEKNDEARHTDKDSTYLENLEYIRRKCIEKQAQIVFATSISRRKFIDGECIDTHLGYPQAMKEFCDKKGYECIDLNKITLEMYNILGEEKTKKFHMIFPKDTFVNYPLGKEDNSHLSYEGAIMVAQSFVVALYETNSSMQDLFLDLKTNYKVDEDMLKD